MDMDLRSLSSQLKDKELFKQQCFIDGKWISSDDGETFDILNPSDATLIGTMPNVKKSETVRAVNAAKKAWSNWKNLLGKRDQ